MRKPSNLSKSSTDKSALRALKASKIIFEISCDFQGYFSGSREGLKIIAWAAKRRVIIDFLFFAIFSRTLSSRNPLTWQSWAASQSQHVLQLIYLKIICSTDFIYSKFILPLSETWIHHQNYSQNKKQTAQLTVPKRTNQTFEMTEIDSLYRPRYNSKIIENIKI